MSVRYERRGDVAILTLKRPDSFNAIEPTLSQGLVEAMDRAGGEARAIAITGEGRAFCAGADLAALEKRYASGDPDLASYLEEVFHPMVTALVYSPLSTVAAINGVAAGAGLGLALACDLRVMAESAFLTSSFTAIGLVPDSGTTWWLPHTVGVSKALELTLTNARVTAEEAKRLGLCVAVTPDGESLETAVSMASDLTDLVPDSLVTTRRLIRDAAGSSFTSALAAEQTEQGRLGNTPEHAEGVKAFLEKRKPDYRGARRKRE